MQVAHRVQRQPRALSPEAIGDILVSLVDAYVKTLIRMQNPVNG
jgi:hypothetical protein